LDLHLDLGSATAPGGVRGRIEAALRDAVRRGRLEPGERLPSSRALAEDLGVARGTVVEVYEQLIGEGWLIARRGSGTYAADLTHPSPAGGGAGTVAAAADVAPFRPGVPDLSAFPRRQWAQAVAEVCRTVPSDELGYGDPRGPGTVRAVLAGYLGRVRGIPATPDDVVITTGLAQALSLSAAVLLRRGLGSVGVEDPGSAGFPPLLERAGLRLRALPVDDHGIRVDALAAAGVDAVVTTPAHQFPLGMATAPERRRMLVAWAARGGLIVEDDYDAEFRYDRRPVGALQPLAPDRVLYMGSVSKTLAPGLRLGWLVAPRQLRDELVASKATTDLSTPVLDAHALGSLITGGAYDRHLRRLRRVYRRRRDNVLALLSRHPWLRPRGIAAGLHLVAEILDGPGADEVVAVAASRGLDLRAVGDYALEHPAPDGLVIGYGSLTPTTERHALEQLDAALTAARHPERPGTPPRRR
jgi:GntR family transcriptional regulator/MocR family aminotransferase